MIELLVVITIIAVLLALLTPALDQAIYQAELAVCGANQKGTVTGTQVYAMANKRAYPRRATGSSDSFNRVEMIAGQWVNYLTDFRPVLRSYLSINASLNDPLAPAVDFEDVLALNSNAYSSALLWFGYRYKNSAAGVAPDRSMYHMGDRWSYTDSAGFTQIFSLMVSDLATLNDTWLAASHPDREGRLYNERAQNQDMTRTGQGPADGAITDGGPTKRIMSRWAGWANVPSPATLDTNWGYDDGSVQRVAQMTLDGRDKRLTHVALYWDSSSPLNQIYLPDQDR